MAAEEVKAILKRAIKMEEDSYALYTSAGKRIKDAAAKAGLEDLASQEKQHKAKLEALLAGKLSWAARFSGQEKDLKIGEYFEAKPLSDESSMQDVLIVAAKREEATGAFYTQMAGLADPGPEKDLFELLAKEEIKHKRYVESVYENVVYKEF